MADKELEQKIEYFNDLLDISDDETGFPDEGLLRAERALADTKAMPPPRLVRQKSSFLGPTPREKQAEFEAHTQKKRASARANALTLVRADTAPEANSSSTFTTIPSAAPSKETPKIGGKLKRNTSLPDLPSKAHVQDEVPFYKRTGVVPRELKRGKNVKLADKIKIEPEHKQLLRGKVIYFYPNDDVSMARRQRIHKVIQLGAAWLTTWRDDITHIIVEDADTTYSQVLKKLNRAGLPRNVVLVKFDPYVPQCIQFNTLLDPTAKRFQVKGAPAPTMSTTVLERSPSPSSQVSLQIKQSKGKRAAEDSQKTDSISVQDSFPPPLPSTTTKVTPPSLERVPDSFPPFPGNGAISSEPSEEPTDPQNLYNDALSEAIQQMKAISHLPLDDDEDSDSAPSRPSTAGNQDSDTGTDDDVPEPNSKRHKRFAPALPPADQKKSKGFNQLAFQCMDPRASNATGEGNPNARTIEILEAMGRYYDQMGDTWRTLAYRRGVGVLRKQPVKICTKEQAETLPFIGSRLAEKIEEIVLTNRLRKLDNTRDDPTDKNLRLFLGIYGVGLSQAHKWIQAGYRTLDDLVQKAKLSDNQKVGIEHYTDFATRIPRSEVEAHGAYVRTALRKLDPGFEIKIMGSYRRGAKDSGDIDLIITKPGTPLSTMRTIIFETLVPKLFASGFLKVSLATSRRHDEGTKWHGASCLPGSTIWRRLDLLLVPEEEMGAALIYFTGNDIFNRSIRLLASKHGMRLNQKGLYKDVIRGKNRERITEGTLVEGRSERKIFEILGVPWRKPTERIC